MSTDVRTHRAPSAARPRRRRTWPERIALALPGVWRRAFAVPIANATQQAA